MERREFLKKGCGICILGMANVMIPGLLKAAKADTLPKYVAELNDAQELIVPLNQFTNGASLIVTEKDLMADVAVSLMPNGTYQAVYLQCTHLENRLVATDQGYRCPIHGSEYSSGGQVLKGPAQRALQICSTRIDLAQSTLFISVAAQLAGSSVLN